MGTKRSRYSLDEDLILEIFSRLPAKSLMRFRCVSKEWYSLTKSSYLINIHLRRSDSKLCYLLAYTSFRDERFTKPKIGISRLGDEATDIWIPQHEVNNYYGYAKLVDYVESLVLV
ncbi:hypothetical protein M0R45_002680 [Rubus argutus]|uniref:F-box domain-containing protein n=1 Tax=Rubus argutus TaxID=59490 RepID=A0AAW1VQV3_RUBAR